MWSFQGGPHGSREVVGGLGTGVLQVPRRGASDKCLARGFTPVGSLSEVRGVDVV